MSKLINRIALLLDNALLGVKARAMECRQISYPNIHHSVRLGGNVKLIGPSQSFLIGKDSYINDAIIVAGKTARVSIGICCSIGYRVSIKAVTHDVAKPCRDECGHIATIENDIIIGNFCWIGDNVFIREGVSIGDNVIVGANSVVTKSFGDNVIVAGVPAVVIKTRNVLP